MVGLKILFFEIMFEYKVKLELMGLGEIYI